MADSVHSLAVVWSASAQKSFFATLEKIESEDVGTAGLAIQRDDKSISLIAAQPSLGAFTSMQVFAVMQFLILHIRSIIALHMAT
nr:hypothetical protein [uncultured Undibacterium sp.]